MIESISHITFIVKDLDRTAQFFRTIFDAEEVYDGARKNYSISYEKFFVVGGIWIAILAGEPLSERTYNHVAFKVSEADFDDYLSKIKQLGLELAPGRKRVKGEARSIYFYDYDNHLFELHTGTLRERIASYNGNFNPDRLE